MAGSIIRLKISNICRIFEHFFEFFTDLSAFCRIFLTFFVVLFTVGRVTCRTTVLRVISAHATSFGYTGMNAISYKIFEMSCSPIARSLTVTFRCWFYISICTFFLSLTIPSIWYKLKGNNILTTESDLNRSSDKIWNFSCIVCLSSISVCTNFPVQSTNFYSELNIKMHHAVFSQINNKIMVCFIESVNDHVVFRFILQQTVQRMHQWWWTSSELLEFLTKWISSMIFVRRNSHYLKS